MRKNKKAPTCYTGCRIIEHYLVIQHGGEHMHLDPNEVKKIYEDMVCIWPETDQWHTYTYKYMCSYLKKEIPQFGIQGTTKILNAGSAGNTYDIGGEHHHVDICYSKISHLEHALEASIEALPYAKDSFDGCICMGSVINYCDAAQALFELSRVIRPGGFLVFDFEQSGSLQFIGSEAFDKNAIIVDTFNSGQKDRLWVYSLQYILSILESAGFIVQKRECFHIFSSFMIKLLRNENKAAIFGKYDVIAKRIPFVRKRSCNVILTCRKL